MPQTPRHSLSNTPRSKTSRLFSGFAALLAVVVTGGWVVGDVVAQDQGGEARPAQREGREGRGAPGNVDPAQRFRQADPTMGMMMTLGQLNMTPEFTLTPDQKTKIQAAREAFKLDRENYIAEQAQKIEFVRVQITEARAGRDREAEMEAYGEMRAIFTGGPGEADFTNTIKGILTKDQVAILDATIAEREQAAQQMREERERRRNQPREEEPTI